MQFVTSVLSIILIIVFTFKPITAQNKTNEFPILKGEYLGQVPPGTTPEIFAPGIICTPETWEAAVSFSPDGIELFFTRRKTIGGSENRILYTKKVNGVWTEPELAPFAKNLMEYEALFTSDGNKLYFSSGRAKPSGISTKGRIWFAERTSNGWGEAQYLAPEINDGWAMYVSSAANGSLYFNGGYNRKYGIYNSKYNDGSFSKPEYLPGEINDLFGTSHPFIAPDESYIIFDAQPGGMAKTDLYISFKDNNGKWTKAVKFDERVNATKTENIPTVSPDGKYFFFSRTNDIYWVSTKIIDDIKPDNIK